MTAQQAFQRELGRKLFTRRRALNITRAALALELGCNRNTIGLWESGEHAMTLLDYLRVCDLLKANVFALMPAQGYTWGVEAPQGEKNPSLRAVVRERDPKLTKREANW